jgi:hypothetical protein
VVRLSNRKGVPTLARCWALGADLKAIRCSREAGTGHWFCHQHRRWLLKIIIGTVVIGGLLLPSVQSYLWGLFAPPTKVEKEHTAHLEDIDKKLDHILSLLENKYKRPQELTTFIDTLGLEQKYPLGFALFYSDGRRTISDTRPSSGSGISFDPSTLKVTRIGDSYCMNILPVRIRGKLLDNYKDLCVSELPPGAHVAKVGDVLLDIEPLALSSGGAAWVLGMKPAT